MSADVSPERHEQSAWQILAPVIDLITPMAIRAVAALRLADLLVDGPVPVADLARRTGTDADALTRVLRHLIARGVFEEPTPGFFAANDTAVLLHSNHPSGIRTGLDMEQFGGRMDLAFTDLLHTLRTGKPAWEKTFGAPFWDYLAENPAMSASFDATMAASTEYVEDGATGYDWSGVRHVVDVGGGSGALLAVLLDAHPQLRATLVDLPDTVERGRTYLEKRGLDERCAFAGQSFFDPLPANGDIYVLASVLHDWPDGDATKILRRCADAAGTAGRVLIIDQQGRSDAASFAEMNLRMLVFCGGRERDIDEFAQLARAVGLFVTSVETTRLGQMVIECSTQPAGMA